MGKKREASFEDLLEEAESIVSELEAGALPLEEALRKYEKGVANLQACAKMLHAAEEKIKVLIEFHVHAEHGSRPFRADFFAIRDAAARPEHYHIAIAEQLFTQQAQIALVGQVAVR